MLQSLCSQNRVKLCWVPGHTNIKGNEEADRLARLGSQDETMIILNVKLPLSELKADLKDRINRKRNFRWEKITTCRVFRQLYPRRKPPGY